MRKHVKQMVLLVAAGAMMATVLVGCKDKPSCKLLYKRYNKCEKDFPVKEKAFLKMCKKRKKDVVVQEEIKCSVKKSCDAFKKCIKDSSKKAEMEKLNNEIDKAISSKKYEDALSTCRYSKKRLNDALKKKCADLSGVAYKDLLAKATAGRNSGLKQDWKVCSSLKRAGENIGKKAEAEALCKEWDLAKDVKKALAKAAEAMKKPKVSLPFDCSWTAAKLAKVKAPSAWLKKQTKLIVSARYVALGKKILAKDVAAKYKFCTYAMGKILKGVKQFKIKDPGLDPLVVKAEAICTKKKK